MCKFATLLALGLATGIGSSQLHGQGGEPGSVVQAGPPLYPLAAKAAGIEGKVVLEGIIDIDGHIKNLRVVKGPPELREAAVNAVMHWVYRPYTDHGKAVPTPTTANVVFTLGNKKQKVKAMAEAQGALAKMNESASDSTAAPPRPKDQ